MHPYHNRIITIIIINFIKVSKPCSLGEPILVRGHISIKYNTDLYKIQYRIKRLRHLHLNMSIKVKKVKESC